MKVINVGFVVAVHDEIIRQTGVGRAGVYFERLESVLGRIDQHRFITTKSKIFMKLPLGMALL